MGILWATSDVLNEYFLVEGGDAGLFGPSGAGNLFEPGTLAGPQTTTLINDKGKSVYNAYLRDFAPTVGFAWQPHSDGFMKHFLGDAGKTVLRAGYNISYNREGLAGYDSTIAENLGFFWQSNIQLCECHESLDRAVPGGLGTPGADDHESPRRAPNSGLVR